MGWLLACVDWLLARVDWLLARISAKPGTADRHEAAGEGEAETVSKTGAPLQALGSAVQRQLAAVGAG